MRRYLIMAAVAAFTLLMRPLAGFAQDPVGLPGTALAYSKTMFDRQNHVTDKIALALKARRDGQIQANRLYFGGRFVGTAIGESTNTAGKFPILSRLPPTHTRGTSDIYGVVNEASLNVTLTLPMVTAFAQAEYSEVEYPGQDAVQLRKYWVTLGDLNRSPFYLAVGRKTVNFGNFASYAPFTHTHNSHYFWAQSRDPLIELGYVMPQTELAFSLISDHRGNRVLSSPGNEGDYRNLSLNGSHRFAVGNGLDLTLGAGFLRGTIYDSRIAHHPPSTGVDRDWNGAWDVNATLSGARFDLMAEFTQTEKVWPATDYKVSALTVQGRYRSDVFGKPAVWSLSMSRGRQGEQGTEWEKMDQIILGLEVEAAKHVSVGLEYMFNKGFVPLIVPTIAGDRDVQSDTLIAGVKMTF